MTPLLADNEQVNAEEWEGLIAPGHMANGRTFGWAAAPHIAVKIALQGDYNVFALKIINYYLIVDRTCVTASRVLYNPSKCFPSDQRMTYRT